MGIMKREFWEKCLSLKCFRCYPQQPLNGFFFVAAVTTRVDSYGDEFAAFAPAFDGQSGDAQDGGDFFDSE